MPARITALSLFFAIHTPLLAQWDLSKMKRQAAGKTVFHGLPIEASIRNKWPQTWEDQFQQRASHIITLQCENQKPIVNTFFK